MHSFALFAVVWGGALVFCQDNCRVPDGKDGLQGIPGREGLPGPKGEKGQPALQVKPNMVALDEIKGEMGSRGPQGPLGEKGIMGKIGEPGAPGPKGSTGSSGNTHKPIASQRPAFSVLRNVKDLPEHNKAVTFNTELSNVKQGFNLQTGRFICRVPGVYYFVFHAVTQGHLCLRLKSDSETPASVSFCNLNPNSQFHVLSGGAVLKLAQNDKVWIEPFKENSNKMSTKPEKGSTVFNGFLIYGSA